jgi:hypothetical protein
VVHYGFLNYWINYYTADGDIRSATKAQSAMIGFSTGASEVRAVIGFFTGASEVRAVIGFFTGASEVRAMIGFSTGASELRAVIGFFTSASEGWKDAGCLHAGGALHTGSAWARRLRLSRRAATAIGLPSHLNNRCLHPPSLLGIRLVAVC